MTITRERKKPFQQSGKQFRRRTRCIAAARWIGPGRDGGDPLSGRKETNAMAEETVYLELSEEGGGSHKFYELVVAGTQVRIRFGRIGDAGQAQASDYATAALPQTFAVKKIPEKVHNATERAALWLPHTHPCT